MELQTQITRENVERLMVLFYEKAVVDDEIGVFFRNDLGDDLDNEDWEEHVGRLTDFWLAILLGEETYKGKPFGPHFNMHELRHESFMRWIEIFSKTVDSVFTPEIAKLFKKEGVSYSKDFMRQLNIKS